MYGSSRSRRLRRGWVWGRDPDWIADSQSRRLLRGRSKIGWREGCMVGDYVLPWGDHDGGR